MMNEFEQNLHDNLHHLSIPQRAEAYHDLMEGIRSRIDAEMLAFTFEQTKLQMHRQEQVVKAAAAQGLTHAG